MERMRKGKILAGEEHLSVQGCEAQWKNDMFCKLHKDDVLWAYMIWCSDELAKMNSQLKGPVMGKLLHMGMFDWTGVDSRLNQTTPAMHHATAIASRLTTRLLEEESKVGNGQDDIWFIPDHRHF